MSITICQESLNHHQVVYQLHQLAFGQENESQLVELLRKSDAFVPELSLVALLDEKVVGHILFSKIRIKNEQGETFDSLALAPMAVLPDWQRKRIGSQLIRCGLDKAKELGYTSVIVLGHQDYYPKFGFVPAEKWNIRPPFEVPSEVFMGIELVENGLYGVSGMVEYAEAFSKV